MKAKDQWVLKEIPKLDFYFVSDKYFVVFLEESQEEEDPRVYAEL